MLTKEEIRERLHRAGLTCIEHSYFGGTDPMNRMIGRFASHRRARNMHIVAARRA
jgi:hypothetical protein